MRDPNPVVFLVPGVGMLTFARDKSTARVSAEYFLNAIHVMRGAEALSSYVALPEAEAFGIEYWLLEEAKLKRLPPEKELARRVALITGGAGGIGRAMARKFLGAGAHVVLLDIDRAVLDKVVEELGAIAGRDRVVGVKADVTSEDEMRAAFDEACLRFGGVDLAVANAGIASSAPVDQTPKSEWDRNMAILGTGYFLCAKEAFRVMRAQKTGGGLIFICSKNAVYAGKNAGAYSAAKAAELHLARCLAEEGAPIGIRVNVVNPDAVLAGSRIWNESSWRDERAKAYGIKPEDLEEFYRQRNTLKVHIYPDDVAEAVLWFASDRSAKTTGNMLNVDGGVPAAFPR
jgi:rhamnulose-1-phosphate aldolase/alcohol dehydrogenase